MHHRSLPSSDVHCTRLFPSLMIQSFFPHHSTTSRGYFFYLATIKVRLNFHRLDIFITKPKEKHSDLKNDFSKERFIFYPEKKRASDAEKQKRKREQRNEKKLMKNNRQLIMFLWPDHQLCKQACSLACSLFSDYKKMKTHFHFNLAFPIGKGINN